MQVLPLVKRVVGVTALFVAAGAGLLLAARRGILLRPEEPGQWTLWLFFALYWGVGCLGVLVIHFRRRWPEILLVVASVALAVFLVECALWWLCPITTMRQLQTDNSKEFHHIYPKNKTMYMVRPDHTVQMLYTNEDGLRTRYSRSEFLRYPHRVVVLGDSFVFGPKVTQNALFTERAEALVRERRHADDVAVLNAGIISYSPFLERQLFNKIIKNAYRPETVLLFLDVTDFGDDLVYEREAAKEGDEIYFYRRPKNYPDHWCALQEIFRPYSDTVVNALRYPYLLVDANCWRRDLYQAKNFRYYDFSLPLEGVVERNRYFVYRHPLPVIEPYLRNTLSIVNSVAQSVRASGAQFVLFVLPRYHHWNPQECPKGWEVREGDYRVDEPYQYAYLQFFDQVAKTLPYDMVNLLPAFQATKETGLVFEFDAHWNDKGNAFVAGIVADFLVEHCLGAAGAPAAGQ